MFPDIFLEPALGDGIGGWEEAGLAVKGLEAGVGVCPSGEGADDGIAGVFEHEWGAAAAAAVDDTERRQVAF